MKLLNNSLNKDKILEVAGKLFSRGGYQATSLEDIADEASMHLEELETEVENKEFLCAAWLSEMHNHSEKRHQEILANADTPIEKVQKYFEHLKNWMEEFGFTGCPYTNTSNSLGSEDSPAIRHEVQLHKHFVCDFFVQLSGPFTKCPSEAEWLGRGLFLLYSAGTTEAKNLREVWPIEHASRLAVQMCEAALEGNIEPEA